MLASNARPYLGRPKLLWRPSSPTLHCHHHHNHTPHLLILPQQRPLSYRSRRSYTIYNTDINDGDLFLKHLARIMTLKKWLQDKLPWPQPTADHPPLLPMQRLSILTPSPSKEDLALSMKSYGYFQLLPYEIRRQILTKALGGRTLHVDLTYLNRPVRKKGKYITSKDGKYILAREKTWEWYSCECHQANVWPDGVPRRNFGERWITKQRKLPCGDGCKDGKNYGKYSPVGGERPMEHPIGAMGWLLACRQA